ncbi:MAG: DinB family protein [Leptospiraceae bacterium]|nr:DinB family protein [Leptospiraceae bacterium]MCP5496890.1 DinB family protein [Leptospiraceae bacterium]
MYTLPTVHFSENKEDLIQQVRDVHNAIVEFYRSTPDEFFTTDPIPEGWSIKRNMKHVASSNKIFSVWIGAPRFFLKLFGKPKKNPPPPVEKIIPTNRLNITDYGKYSRKRHNTPEDREKLVREILASAEKVCQAIEKRTEEELDSFRSPFGGFSLRTFCHFLIKHNLHHTGVVRTRLTS